MGGSQAQRDNAVPAGRGGQRGALRGRLEPESSEDIPETARRFSWGTKRCMALLPGLPLDLIPFLLIRRKWAGRGQVSSEVSWSLRELEGLSLLHSLPIPTPPGPAPNRTPPH